MKKKFAWFPLPISEMHGRTWYYTGEYAWLEWVQVIDTVWADRIFVRICAKTP
jgi:hypothetical protein